MKPVESRKANVINQNREITRNKIKKIRTNTMARSKENKERQQRVKNAAAKLKKRLGAENIDDLINQMTEQDTKENADDSSPSLGRSKKEDLPDEEEDTKEIAANKQEYAKAIEAVMNANIEDGTKHTYQLNLV